MRSRDHLVPFPGAQPGTCVHCGRPTTGTSRSHDVCREQSARDRDYRGTAKARDADDGVMAVCVDAYRSGCDGELQADHVQRLADNGPRDWTVWRCVKHHQEKTAAENTTKGRKVARGKEQNHSDSTGMRGVVVAGGVAAAGYPLLVNWPPVTAVATGTVYGAAVVGGGVLRARRGRRREAAADLRTALARATHTVPEALHVDHLRWKGGAPVAGRARYGGATNDAPGSRERATVEELLTRKAGQPCVFGWDPPRNRVTWRPRTAADPTVEVPPHPGAVLPAAPDGEVAARVRASLSAATKGDVLLNVTAADVDGSPRVMVARYGEHVRDDSDDVRAALQGVVNAKAPGRWRADWDTADNRVTFTRRPQMPSMVPAEPTPPSARGVWGPVPVGVDEDGATVRWDTDVTPHLLVVGSTGSGKSVVMANLILAVLARGADVALIDGKGTTLAGFRGLPGIRYVGLGEPQDMADAMDACETEMRWRYGQVRDRGAEPTDFRPLVVFLDEAAEFATTVDQWWKSVGKKAAESPARDAPAVTAWRSIARLGREGRVHLVVGLQQAAASFFQGTESRDQLAGRIACGPLTEQGARMAFGRADVGRDLPVAAKGRATVDLGAGIKEVQTFWTPTPKPSGDVREEHEEVLRPLLDAIPPRVPVGRDAEVLRSAESSAPVRVDVKPPAPVTEFLHPRDLARGDAVSWDEERRVVLSVDDDEALVRVEFRLPGGGTEVVAFDADDLVERID